MNPSLTFQTHLDAPPLALGEGLYYSHSDNILYWVDIHQAVLFINHLSSNAIEQHQFDEAICWVNKATNGKLLIGLRSGIYFYDLTSRKRTLVWLNPKVHLGLRLNDAKTDKRGHLYFGTMDDNETAPIGQLFQLVTSSTVKPIDDNYTVSNGPAFNIAGDTLYSVSSSERTIYKLTNFEYSTAPNKSIFATLPYNCGYPDGITVDSEDNVWVACWGGGAILCFNQSAQLLAKFPIPAPYVTNIIFAGCDLQDVYVTTATSPMTGTEKVQFPNAGKVFKFRTNVPGIKSCLANI